MLDVTGLVGFQGQEKVTFFTSLASYDLQKSSEWFMNLQKIIKSSLSKHIQTYLTKLEAYGLSFNIINFNFSFILFHSK